MAGTLDSIDRYATPLVDRFVSGMMYPAILGANLILLFNLWNQLGGQFWSHVLPWLLTLVLFVLDYVSIARENNERPPFGTLILSLIDIAAALAFFLAHTTFARDLASSAVQQLDWSRLWLILGGLHLLYVTWYVVRLCLAARAFRPLAEGDKLTSYRRYLGGLLCETLIQLALLILWRVNFLGLKPHVAYSTFCGIALLGWFWRQRHEFRNAPWAMGSGGWRG